MNTTIVIPTYNEAKNLECLVEKIFFLHPAFYIIVVDDNSPDGTGAIADALCPGDTPVSVSSTGRARPVWDLHT